MITIDTVTNIASDQMVKIALPTPPRPHAPSPWPPSGGDGN